MENKGEIFMNEITIKNFIEGYNKLTTDSQKERYIKEKIVITKYVPFIRKMTRAKNLVKITMSDENTGNIRINSITHYLFFIKTLIEEYTNLISELPSFADEYDMLKQSGFLDRLILKVDGKEPLIDPSELDEFKQIVNMAKSDLIDNEYEPHAFISGQISRLKAIGEVALTPLVEVLSKKLDEIPKEDLEEKILEFAKKGNFKEV